MNQQQHVFSHLSMQKDNNPLFCNPPALPSADCHCPICRSNATVPPPIGMAHSPADRLIIYKVDVTHINFLILN